MNHYHPIAPQRKLHPLDKGGICRDDAKCKLFFSAPCRGALTGTTSCSATKLPPRVNVGVRSTALRPREPCRHAAGWLQGACCIPHAVATRFAYQPIVSESPLTRSAKHVQETCHPSFGTTCARQAGTRSRGCNATRRTPTFTRGVNVDSGAPHAPSPPAGANAHAFVQSALPPRFAVRP